MGIVGPNLPVFGQNPKLARLLQYPWHLPEQPAGPFQGVIIMSVTKFQNVALSFVAALTVASMFVGAALEPVISLA